MKIIIAENMEEFNEIAADIVSRQIRNKPDSVLGLATGSTPSDYMHCWPISIRRENGLFKGKDL